MNPTGCCERPQNGGERVGGQNAWLHRTREFAGWIIPGTLLALMPKCPLCLAAYVAMGTGLTISCSSAHLLLCMLTTLGIGTLAWGGLQHLRGYGRKRPTHNP